MSGVGMTSAGAGSQPQNVIDLTEDDATASPHTQQATAPQSEVAGTAGSHAQRPPRFGRNIIDLASEGEEEASSSSNTHGHEHERAYLGYFGQAARRSRDRPHPQYSSLRRPTRQPTPPAEMDDVEIVSARLLSRPQSRLHTPTMNVPRSITPYPGERIDLTGDDDDVIVTRASSGLNAARPSIAGSGVGTRDGADYSFAGLGHIANILRGEGANLGGRLMRRIEDLAGHGGDYNARERARASEADLDRNRHGVHHFRPQREERHADLHPHFAPAMPANTPHGLAGLTMMNYEQAAFDMGLGGGGGPPTPKYTPPPEVARGFTRNPEEDEVVVCPNCGDELALGESEVKQQVWVVKGCGHVSFYLTAKSYVSTLTFQ